MSPLARPCCAAGPDDPRTLEVSTSLGLVYLEREKPELAEQMLTDALSPRSERWERTIRSR